MPEKTIGIIGGMGPEATADLYLKIIHNTPAKIDQEHMHVLIDGNAKIPNREKAVCENGEDPSPYLARMAIHLFESGADYLAIACNTAHYFYDAIQAAVPIPVLHMPRITMSFIKKNYPLVHTVGLFATETTIRTGLYQKIADEFEITLLVLPNPYQHELVQNSIYLIKAGEKTISAKNILSAAEMLIAQGAELLIIGCTEIPLVFEEGMTNVPILDPTLILAKEIIAKRNEEDFFS